jgi:hypothetical protein
MDNEEISGDVRSFLLNAIGSYEELELLLLLHAHADEQWSPEAAAARLGLPVAAASGALEQLRRHGLLEVPATPPANATLAFKYSSGNASARLVDAVAAIYATNRLGLMRVMSQNAIERVRTRALNFFSDAFIVGRKRDRDG